MTAYTFWQCVGLGLMAITASVYLGSFGNMSNLKRTTIGKAILWLIEVDQSRAVAQPRDRMGRELYSPTGKTCSYCRQKHARRYPRQPEDCYRT